MNLNRFINVARYNFAINRAQYMKLALSLVLAMSLPLLIFIVKSIWVSAITHNTEWALASIPGTDMGNWMSVCFVFAWPILAGYTFHNLLTKQSRIKELTLPASNCEKFLFHALVTIVGSLLAYVVGYFMLDILQYFYVGIVYGFSNAEWIPYSSIFFAHNSNMDIHLIDGEASLWFTLISEFYLVAFLSTFVLGNAIKYKHNVLWTILFHWALGFIVLICMGMLVPMLKDIDADWLLSLDKDKVVTYLKVGSLTLASLITIFCWWMSYRLYCRAQITTKRNK